MGLHSYTKSQQRERDEGGGGGGGHPRATREGGRLVGDWDGGDEVGARVEYVWAVGKVSFGSRIHLLYATQSTKCISCMGLDYWRHS